MGFYTTYIFPWDNYKVIFHINNNIDWNQFHQSYDLNQLKNCIQNTDIIAHEIRAALTKAMSLKLEVAKEKMQKKKQIV